MAPHSGTEQTARAEQGGGTVNPAATRVLMVGIVGAALLLGVVAGLAAGRGGPVASVPEQTTTGALASAATDDRYRLSPPNEHDLGDSASGIPATGGQAAYRVSTSSGLGPEGTSADCLAHADQLPYRVSPDPGP